MPDIIAELLDTGDGTRTAQGSVDGVLVAVRKDSYLTRDQTEHWKVEAVTIEGDKEAKMRLTEPEADDYFESLLNRYNLTED